MQLFHGDIRMASDFETLPLDDWVIDAAAQPSVLAGRDGKTSARQLLEHNLLGTINLLEYCRASGAGFILLSTSRVYSIPTLTQLPLRAESLACTLDKGSLGLQRLVWPGSEKALARRRRFRSTARPSWLQNVWHRSTPPVSSAGLDQPLWGAGGSRTVWHRRAGHLLLLAARALRAALLKVLGLWRSGFQVRDALHPETWRAWWMSSCGAADRASSSTYPAARANSMSLAQLTVWCDQRFGPHQPIADGSERPYDVPWLILDSSKALTATTWKPHLSLHQILEEIADHAAANPDWLTLCGA